MSLTRRRFLAISAACLATATASGAQPETRWQGTALGADASITLRGDPAAAREAIQAARDAIRHTERLFSLFDPASALSRLNRDGRLSPAPEEVRALLALCDHLHGVTGGLFDPSVQPLWQALATGRDPAPALALAGWDGVRRDRDVTLARPGMALTLNGIAQGWATDRVADLLRARSFGDVLVNLGELRALGSWQTGIADLTGTITPLPLRDMAAATSAPRATLVGGKPHILHPRRGPVRPEWELVTVLAPSAAVADGLSTALCLAPEAAVAEMLRAARATRARLVRADGSVSVIPA